MAREESVEENGRGRKMNADSSLTSCEPSDLYWFYQVMQSLSKKILKITLKKQKQNYAATNNSKHALKMLNSNLHLLTAETLNRW